MMPKSESIIMSNGSEEKKRVSVASHLIRLFLPIAIVFLCVILTILSPYFLTLTNFMNLLLAVSVIAIVAVGENFVIITSGIDISVGSITGLIGVISAVMLRGHVPIPLTILIALTGGLLIGLVNGLAIAGCGMSPFIVTLVGLTVFRGVAIAITGGLAIAFLPPQFNFIGSGEIGFLPVPVIIMFFVYALAVFISRYTVFGRHVYALGESKRASFQAGLRVKEIEIFVYMMSGLAAAMGGIIMTARLGAAHPLAASGLELQCIAAVVLGGTSLMGGRGEILGTLLGAVLIGIIGNGLNLMNVSPYYSQIVYGITVFVILMVDALSHKRYRVI